MAARGGIYRRLRDKTLSWQDKLKLLRYAWKHDAVFILNKQQVLLDWLCLALAGKKRVEPPEAAHVWQCFHDVLHTKKCQQLTNQGQPLVLKSSIFQVVLDELSAVVTSKSRHCSSDDVIISCCLCLMTSPNLANTVTCKFDFTLQLLTCVTEVCLKEMMSHRIPSDNMVQLLEVALDKYRVAHRQKVVLQQMVQQSAQKLLLPTLLLAHSTHQHQGASLYETTNLLRQTLLEALFVKELLVNFELYLKLMTDKATGSESSPPKYIQCIFTILEEALTQQDKAEPVLRFLPTFYKNFLKQYKGTETTLGFKLLQHLCDILHIGPSYLDPPMDVDPHPSIELLPDTATELRLLALGDFLKVVADAGVYDVTGSAGSTQTEWFSHLTAWLMTLSNRSSSWFGCVRGLLQLSYVLLEPQLVNLLDTALRSLTPRDSASEEARDALLCELLTVYERLRQQAKFFKKLLLAFRAKKQDEDVAWLHNFTRLLCVCITTMPTAALLEVWQALIQEVTSHYLHMLSDDSRNTTDCSAICQLFSHLLLNAKVIDYSVTHQTATRLQHCMTETKEKVLAPLLTAVLDKRKVSPSTLELVHSWGDLHILLQHYANHFNLQALAFQPISAVMTHNDLTFVHSYLDGDIWRKIFACIDKSGEVRLKFLLQKLMVQKLKAVILFSGESETNAAVRASIQNVIAHLVADIPTKNVDDSAICWNGEISTVDGRTHCVALWQLLCQHCSLVVPSCTAVQLRAFVDYLLWTISTPQTCSAPVSLESVTTSLLSSPEFQECRQLQSVFLTAFWQLLSRNLGNKKSSSPKKAKKDLPSVTELVSRLGSSDICWHSVELNDLMSKEETVSQTLHEVCTGTGSLVTQGKTELGKGQRHDDREKSLLNCLKLLKRIPLQSLAVADEIRCILGLLLATLHSVQVQTGSDRSELVLTCIDTLTVVLEGAKHTSFIFQRIKIGHVISRFSDIRKSQTNLGRRHFDPLLKVMLKLATREEMTTSDLDGFITQLRHKMAALRTAETAVDAELTVSTIVVTLQFFAKMLQRKNMQDDVRMKLEEYHTVLTADFLRHAMVTLKAMTDSDVIPFLLTGVAGVIEHLSHDDGDSATSKKVGVIVASLSHHCQKLCDTSNSDIESLTSCMTFIRAVAKCDEITRDFVPARFLRDSWTRLVTILKQLYSGVGGRGLKNTSREETECTTDGDVSHKKDLQGDIRQTLVIIIGTLSLAEFSQIIYSLVDKVDVSSLHTDQTELTISLDIWQQLLGLPLDEESTQLLVQTSQNLLLRIEGVLLGCQVGAEIYPAVIESSLNTLTRMLSEGRALLSPQSVMLCLQCCQVAPLTEDYTQTSSAVFEALYSVLNEMLLQHAFVVFGCIPAFISAAKRLLKVAMHTGQQRSEHLKESHAITYCRLVDRLFTLISTHKVEFAKVACYLVADYVGELQKVTLLPATKKCLLPAIHKLLDMCDQHSVTLLHTVLTAGTREVFKSLYSDYTKFYKYTGRV